MKTLRCHLLMLVLLMVVLVLLMVVLVLLMVGLVLLMVVLVLLMVVLLAMEEEVPRSVPPGAFRPRLVSVVGVVLKSSLDVLHLRAWDQHSLGVRGLGLPGFPAKQLPLCTSCPVHLRSYTRGTPEGWRYPGSLLRPLGELHVCF